MHNFNYFQMVLFALRNGIKQIFTIYITVYMDNWNYALKFPSTIPQWNHAF